jgi:hypothetical protein
MMMKSSIKKDKTDIFKLLTYDHSFTLVGPAASPVDREEQ